jgi:hypothetical protein
MTNKLLWVVVAILIVALVGSNVRWLRQAEHAVAQAYDHENRVVECTRSLDQATRLIRVLSKRYSEAEIRDAATQAIGDRSLDDDWIGYLSFEFAGDGSLRVWTKCEL